MERIDYETYTRRAGSLRSQAIADFNRGIVRTVSKAVSRTVAGVVQGFRAARGALRSQARNLRAPDVRTC